MNMIKIALVAAAFAAGTGSAFADNQRAGGGFYETRIAVSAFGDKMVEGARRLGGINSSKPANFGQSAAIEDVRSRETQNN